MAWNNLGSWPRSPHVVRCAPLKFDTETQEKPKKNSNLLKEDCADCGNDVHCLLPGRCVVELAPWPSMALVRIFDRLNLPNQIHSIQDALISGLLNITGIRNRGSQETPRNGKLGNLYHREIFADLGALLVLFSEIQGIWPRIWPSSPVMPPPQWWATVAVGQR